MLQKERGSKANQFSSCHNTNSVTKNVCLIHVVSCKDDYAIVLIALKHVPELATSTQVHSSSRFVQENKLRASDESDCD